MASRFPDRKLEFFVVATVLGVAFYLLLGALARVQRESEESAVQSEIAAQRIELLDRLAHREGFGGALPASDNPLRWSGRVPAGYVGEVEDVDGGGVWYFKPSEGVLIHRFRAGDEWRFRLVRGGRGDGVAVLGGVALLQLPSDGEAK